MQLSNMWEIHFTFYVHECKNKTVIELFYWQKDKHRQNWKKGNLQMLRREYREM